jgi:hypothetical protein
LQLGVQVNQERNRARFFFREVGDEFLQQGAERFGDEIGGELGLQFVGIGKRKFFRIGLDEEIEGIDDRKLGGEVNLDGEFFGLFRKDEARQPIAMRVLLPIHEMRRRPQPNGLRPERNGAIISVTRDVLQSDQNRQGGPFTKSDFRAERPTMIWAAGRQECQCAVAPRGTIA